MNNVLGIEAYKEKKNSSVKLRHDDNIKYVEKANRVFETVMQNKEKKIFQSNQFEKAAIWTSRKICSFNPGLAIKFLIDFSKKSPVSINVLSEIACDYFELGKHELGIEIFKRIENSQFCDIKILDAIYYNYVVNEDYIMADEYIDKMLKLEPNHPYALYEQACSYYHAFTDAPYPEESILYDILKVLTTAKAESMKDVDDNEEILGDIDELLIVVYSYLGDYDSIYEISENFKTVEPEISIAIARANYNAGEFDRAIYYYDLTLAQSEIMYKNITPEDGRKIEYFDFDEVEFEQLADLYIRYNRPYDAILCIETALPTIDRSKYLNTYANLMKMKKEAERQVANTEQNNIMMLV